MTSSSRTAARHEPVMLHGAMASGDLFSVLKVNPMLGRTFTVAEDKLTETGRVVVLSERLFASRFNSGNAANCANENLL